jgi:hypothetical protein
MKNSMLSLALLAVVSLFAAGCGGESAQTTPVGEDEMLVSTAVFCGKCGHTKGSAECCDEACEACASCGLHKGSTLCCKVTEAVAGQDLCGACGQVAGSDACCAEDAEKCADCGLQKGSPLCCKLTSAESAAENTDEGSES